MFTSTNPATGEALASYRILDEAEIDVRIGIAIKGHKEELRRGSIDERVARLAALGAVLRERHESLSQMATAEMGKPIIFSRAEIDKCIALLDHYVATAPRVLAETPKHGAVVLRQPLGPILSIMPWNFPFWQVVRVLAAAIAVGNPLLLKHADNVLGCASMLEVAVRDAGLPDASLQSLALRTDQVPRIIADSRIRGVTLTGSVRAGRAVAQLAGQHGKKSVLELGGSDPFLVLADADLEVAAKAAAGSRLFNGGQACVSAKRFIVLGSVHDEFIDRLAREFEQAIVGRPTLESTTIGPLARLDLLTNLERQVSETIAQGARVHLEGGRMDGPGLFYKPTLLTNVMPEYTASTEETFGPVGAVISVDSTEEGIDLANASPYGLGATVFTADPEKGLSIARQLEAGVVAINTIVASRYDLPFGGVKDSGYGRELGDEGILEFVNAKSVLFG